MNELLPHDHMPYLLQWLPLRDILNMSSTCKADRLLLRDFFYMIEGYFRNKMCYAEGVRHSDSPIALLHDTFSETLVKSGPGYVLTTKNLYVLQPNGLKILYMNIPGVSQVWDYAERIYFQRGNKICYCKKYEFDDVGPYDFYKTVWKNKYNAPVYRDMSNLHVWGSYLGIYDVNEHNHMVLGFYRNHIREMLQIISEEQCENSETPEMDSFFEDKLLFADTRVLQLLRREVRGDTNLDTSTDETELLRAWMLLEPDRKRRILSIVFPYEDITHVLTADGQKTKFKFIEDWSAFGHDESGTPRFGRTHPTRGHDYRSVDMRIIRRMRSLHHMNFGDTLNIRPSQIVELLEIPEFTKSYHDHSEYFGYLNGELYCYRDWQLVCKHQVPETFSFTPYGVIWYEHGSEQWLPYFQDYSTAMVYWMCNASETPTDTLESDKVQVWEDGIDRMWMCDPDLQQDFTRGASGGYVVRDIYYWELDRDSVPDTSTPSDWHRDWLNNYEYRRQKITGAHLGQ